MATTAKWLTNSYGVSDRIRHVTDLVINWIYYEAKNLSLYRKLDLPENIMKGNINKICSGTRSLNQYRSEMLFLIGSGLVFFWAALIISVLCTINISTAWISNFPSDWRSAMLLLVGLSFLISSLGQRASTSFTAAR